jgi:hypothetical protein
MTKSESVCSQVARWWIKEGCRFLGMTAAAALIFCNGAGQIAIGDSAVPVGRMRRLQK